jgi:hypothetical protein
VPDQTNITDFDPATGATTTTLVTTHDRSPMEEATRDGQEHDTWHRTDMGGGTPPGGGFLIDETFDGPADTSLTTMPGWGPSSEPTYFPTLIGDGSITAQNGQAVNLTLVPADCWVEVDVNIGVTGYFWESTLNVRLTSSASPNLGSTPGYMVTWGRVAAGQNGIQITRNATMGPEAAYAFAPGPHTIRAEFRGPVITVFIDGTQVLTWTDPAPVLTDGYVGISTSSDDPTGSPITALRADAL